MDTENDSKQRQDENDPLNPPMPEEVRVTSTDEPQNVADSVAHEPLGRFTSESSQLDSNTPSLQSKQPEQTNTVMAHEMSTPASSNKLKSLFKKPLFYVLMLIFIGLIVGVAMLLSSDSDEADVVISAPVETATQERVTTLGATIALTEGIVELSDDGETWIEASGGESLAQSDYLRTKDDSRAIILFDDGSVTRLDNNTELWLSSLELTGLEVTLVSGQVYSRVIESEKLAFTVVTGNERYESLGTAYKTSTDGLNDVLEVYQSEVKVSSQDKDVSEGNKYDTKTKEIAAIDLTDLDNDEFAQWNKQKDTESEEFKDKLGVLKDREEPAPAPVSSPSVETGISLTAAEVSDGVALSWSLQGLTSQQGFKVVRSSTDSTPTFGENDAQYVGDPLSRSRLWVSEKGGAHFYRVCIYFEGTCSNYSNVVKATSPAKVVTPVISGGVTLAINNKDISWSLTGGNAPHGYKVLLSTSPLPVYPADSILYSGATSAKLPEKPPGTYYVRICKFTNGSQAEGCIDYSNQVEYIVPAT